MTKCSECTFKKEDIGRDFCTNENISKSLLCVETTTGDISRGVKIKDLSFGCIYGEERV